MRLGDFVEPERLTDLHMQGARRDLPGQLINRCSHEIF